MTRPSRNPGDRFAQKLRMQLREVRRSVSGVAKRLNTGCFESERRNGRPRLTLSNVAVRRFVGLCLVDQRDFFQHAVQPTDYLLLKVE